MSNCTDGTHRVVSIRAPGKVVTSDRPIEVDGIACCDVYRLDRMVFYEALGLTYWWWIALAKWAERRAVAGVRRRNRRIALTERP